MAVELAHPASETHADTSALPSLQACLILVTVLGAGSVAFVYARRYDGLRRQRKADRNARELVEESEPATPVASTSTAVSPNPPLASTTTKKRKTRQPAHHQVYVPPLPPGTIQTRSIAVQTEPVASTSAALPTLGRRGSRRQSIAASRADVETERPDLVVKLRALETRRPKPLRATDEADDEAAPLSPVNSVSTPLADTSAEAADEGEFQLTTRSHKRRTSIVSSATMSRGPSNGAGPTQNSGSSSSERSPSSSVSTLATSASINASPKLAQMSRTSSAHPTAVMATPPAQRRVSQPSVASTEDGDDEAYWALNGHRESSQVSPKMARQHPKRPAAIAVPPANVDRPANVGPAPLRSPNSIPPRMTSELPRVPGGDFYFAPPVPSRSRDTSVEGRRSSLPIGMPGQLMLGPPGPIPRRPLYAQNGSFAGPIPPSPHRSAHVLSPPVSPAPSPSRFPRSGPYPTGSPSPGSVQQQQQYAWQMLAAAQHQQHQQHMSHTQAMVAAYQTGQIVALNQQQSYQAQQPPYSRAQSPRNRPLSMSAGPPSTSRRNSFASGQASSNGAARSEHGPPKTRDEELETLRRSTRAIEIDNERKNKELEIAHWRLECVEVERRAEERQTQEAICFFVERAETAEARLRTLEMQVGSSSADESEPSVLNGSSSIHGSPRSRSPALPPLDMSFDPRKIMSPASATSAFLSPYYSGSPAMPPFRRRRTGGRRRSASASSSLRASSCAADDDEDDEDEVQILLSAPSVPVARSVGSEDPELGLGLSEWEVGTSASSVNGGDDFVGHVPTMLARSADPSLRVQPATPTDALTNIS